MKRLLSILFLNLFLFNLVGYYGVYLGLRTSANRVMRAQLDAGTYDDSETITMRIPFTLPYQTDWDAYKRIDGDFEKEGVFYNLVKSKVERDTLIIVYIKDHREASLFKSFTRFVEATTETPLSKKAGKLMEHFTKDYLTSSNQLEELCEGWQRVTSFGLETQSIITPTFTPQSPPPKGI